MSQQPSRFVLLCYNPGQENAGIPVLILEDGPGLKVHVPPNWHAGLDANDREYLSELMSDWEEADSERVPGILRELSELSVGPLRLRDSGIADEPRRVDLLRNAGCS